MLKSREAYYCNLKLFLTFLVIYGHLIESGISQSHLLLMQYKLIYLIHMPLFSFLSGLFIKSEKDCSLQLKKIFPLYVFAQLIAILFGNGSVKLFTPWWHLWYLLSYCSWLCLAWLWFKVGKGKILILICSVLAGCLVGLVPFVEREFSLSRTVVFFPYFWTGLILDSSFNWKKLRTVSIAALFAAVIVICYMGSEISPEFLYQSAPYENASKDLWLRLTCYLLGGFSGLVILAFTTRVRLPFSKIGADTMLPYLLHAPIVLCLRKWDIPWQFDVIIAVSIIYAINVFTQWYGKSYMIISAKRRDSRCQPFKKFMKNMRVRFTNFYYP